MSEVKPTEVESKVSIKVVGVDGAGGSAISLNHTAVISGSSGTATDSWIIAAP